MKKHGDHDRNGELDDSDLLEREAANRHDFLRLAKHEPHLRDTVYRALNASPALMHAWERWSKTSIVVRLRGLLPRHS